jgi:hypothetical protein
MNTRDYGAVPRGGTGFAVATLVEFVTRPDGGKS